MEKLRLDYENKLKKTLDKAFRILESTKTGEIKGIKTLSKISSELKREVERDKGREEEKTYPAPTIDIIKIGDIFYSDLLKGKAKVIKINTRKKEVFLSLKNISLWSPVEKLGIIENKKIPPTKVELNITRESHSQTNIDCRGMRLNDFQNLIENSLLDLSNGTIPYLNVVHGHGEGILKNWLRNYLKAHDEFKWSTDQGNDGSTKIEIK
jgi:DNA mismatch repair protein MutS2